MTNILVPGQPGGSYEMIGKLLVRAMPDATLKYMDSFETAYNYMEYHECILVYTTWEADRMAKVGASLQNRMSEKHTYLAQWETALPDKSWPNWMYYAFNSFVTTNGSTLEDLTEYDLERPLLKIGVYDHPERIIDLKNLLEELGVLEYKIVPYACFTEMQAALKSSKDIDFLFGNSVNLYKRIGAVEVLTSRPPAATQFWLPESGVPQIGDFMKDKDVVANTRMLHTQFGYISQNIDPAIILEHLAMVRDWNDDEILDRGYVRASTLTKILNKRKGREGWTDK